ncbi:MAG TPA: hypothetical protein VGH20_10290 [Myxococcales bacterium]|jgi:hypothetical protein
MEPELTTPERVKKQSGYQAVQPPRRPAWAGIDLDPARRPGHLRTRDPKPFPNSVYPPEPQPGEPAVPRHNRPNKKMPPVFGTSTPLKGVSGAVKRFAYSMPDHAPSHWLLLMLGDRIESWGVRTKRALPIVLPALAIAVIAKALSD